MKYVSTRGGMAPQAFSDILLEGLAPDGGLAVPETLPRVDAATLESWRGLPYADLAFEVLSRFATDIPADDLRALTRAAYRQEAFNSEDIVPLRPLHDGMHLLGLSEGPTLAFKDMAMQFLGQVFEYVLTRRGTTLNILGATSGDTGSAAEYALRGKRGVAVFMLSPHGRMSAFQRAQMYSLQDENIHNIAVHGVFDEAQDIVKALSGDLAFKTRWRLGAVNSINWARIAAQVVYYFHGWLSATTGTGQQVSFAVPSGNFGNILSGHIARRMGLPIRRLVLATNENNVLEEFFRTGIYRPRAPAQTYATSSPSMDISRASNFERFVYDLVDADPARVKALWDDVARDGQFDLSAELPRFDADHGFVAGVSTHADRLSTIKSTYDTCGVLIDPHTADGVKVARQYVEPGIPMLVLETALPAKFSETIEAALGQPAPPPAALANLESLPQRVTVMDCDAVSVRRYIEAHAKV
ncbi:threonine synthase [Bordetella ansorpii]|uniref:Threonine synthase n=1 Tax=Bordetella ansorpii TaxID=288768 RepID=A0A157SV87_9BORD|nr:threonine synthase [Bordetella ansorpii]SAI74265.1 threonine synthase [Bordetella ansorpii]